uniref:Uncharacterized protein n=1 Tax=Arundo donax TaxID=35708 RepID=A0A0A9ECF7_ARUDO
MKNKAINNMSPYDDKLTGRCLCFFL